MFEKWFTQDLQDEIIVQHCESVVFEGDNNSYLVGVHVTDGGIVPTLTGTVSCKVIRPDNAMVTFTGTLSGADVSAVLPSSALTYPGAITVVLKVVSGSDIMTVLKAVFTVEQTSTDTIVDPDNVIPSIEELLDQIDDMEEGTARANAAADALEDMTVSASAVSGTTPTATVSKVSGHYNIAFGLVPSSISSQVTTYQNSTSGNTVPTGTWQSTQPTTPQGQYLWARTVITWSNSQTTTLYSVSRQGIDGSGSVSSVNGESPDANGNVQLPVDATPTANSTALVESGGVYSAIDSVSGDLSTLSTTVSGLSGDVTTLEGFVNQNTSSISSLDLRVSTLEGNSSVEDITNDVTMVKSSGSNASLTGYEMYKCGNVVMFSITMKATGTVSAGSAMAYIDVTGAPTPVINPRATMYYGSSILFGNFDKNTNRITVAVLTASLAANSAFMLTFTYLAEPEMPVEE